MLSASWIDLARGPWGEALGEGKRIVIAHAPTVLGGLAILVGGWIAALIARRVTDRLLRAVRLNRAVEGTRVGSLIGSLGKGVTASRLVGQIAYITVILLTLDTAAAHFGLTGLKSALSGVVGYLPKAAGALVIFAAGTYFGSLAKRSVGGILRELRNPAAGLLETLTEVAIILVATLVALDVLGANLTFITSNLTMLLGALLIVVVFLGCWAMRLPAEELVANYYLRRMLSVGDHVQTSRHEGTVLEFQPLGLILRDAKGDEHFVPAKNLISGLRRRQGLTPD